MAVAGQMVGRGRVYLVRRDPTLPSEIKKTRPCVVVSPDELNEHLRTVIVAPMTSGGRAYPWCPRSRFQGGGGRGTRSASNCRVERFVKRVGQLEGETVLVILERLRRCSPCSGSARMKNFGPNLGPLAPQHDRKSRNTRDQRARRINKIDNPAKSAKPPSPVQIRAAPPKSLENRTACSRPAQAGHPRVFPSYGRRRRS